MRDLVKVPPGWRRRTRPSSRGGARGGRGREQGLRVDADASDARREHAIGRRGLGACTAACLPGHEDARAGRRPRRTRRPEGERSVADGVPVRGDEGAALSHRRVEAPYDDQPPPEPAAECAPADTGRRQRGRTGQGVPPAGTARTVGAGARTNARCPYGLPGRRRPKCGERAGSWWWGEGERLVQGDLEPGAPVGPRVLCVLCLLCLLCLLYVPCDDVPPVTISRRSGTSPLPLPPGSARPRDCGPASSSWP